MTWQDLEEVASLRRAAQTWRDRAIYYAKHPTLQTSYESCLREADLSDLRADEIERRLGLNHRSPPADSKLQGSLPKEDG
jgi:hypothetical protein